MELPVEVMTTGVEPITPGKFESGWVSGNPAGLAATAAVTVLFDLGPNWNGYTYVQICWAIDGPSTTGLVNSTVNGSDTPTPDGRRRLAPAFANNHAGFYVTIPPGDYRTAWFRPVGRYIHVSGTNTDATNALGPSSKITLAAYPN